MKKIIVAIAFLISVVNYAQEQFTEGLLISKMTMSSDNALVNSQLESVGEVKAITYIKNGKSRAEISNPLTGDVTTITNEKEMLVLTNNPLAGGKVYTLQDIELTDEALESVNVVKGTETKTILGYVCDQYTVTINQQGVEMQMELYTTDKIPNVASQQTIALGDKLEGMPLLMIMKMNQLGTNMTITNEVTQIKKESVSDDNFNMTIPEGYKKMAGQ